MSEALPALRVPIDPGRGGVLLANMLASWLDHDPSWTAAAEARDESQDSRAAPPQASLHLPALEALDHTAVIAAVLGKPEELQHLGGAFEADGAGPSRHRPLKS